MPPKRKKAPGKSVPHGEEFMGEVELLDHIKNGGEIGVPVFHRSAEFDAGKNAPFRPDRANLNESVLLHRLIELEAAHVELVADVVRIVDLIVKGDIDSVKFKEILSKRQSKA